MPTKKPTYATRKARHERLTSATSRKMHPTAAGDLAEEERSKGVRKWVGERLAIANPFKRLKRGSEELEKVKAGGGRSGQLEKTYKEYDI